jgi:hypothetical protein
MINFVVSVIPESAVVFGSTTHNSLNVGKVVRLRLLDVQEFTGADKATGSAAMLTFFRPDWASGISK